MKSSNLVQRHPSTCADIVEGVDVVQNDEITIISLWGRPKNTRFRLKMAIFGRFLDLAHSLGLVNSSNLVPRHPNTSADVVEGVYVVQSDEITIISLWGRPKIQKKLAVGTCLRPPEASRGLQRQNQVDNSRDKNFIEYI